MFRTVSSNRFTLYFFAFIAASTIGMMYLCELLIIETENTIVQEALADQMMQMPVKHTGWKTYRNEQYGFEFKYPPAFKDPVEKDKTVYFGSVYSEYLEDNRLAFTVIKYQGQSLDQIISQEETTPQLSDGRSGVAYFSIEKYAVDGKEARKFDAHLEGGFLTTDVYIINGSYVYKFFYNTDTQGASSSEFEKILLTLRFFPPKQ